MNKLKNHIVLFFLIIGLQNFSQAQVNNNASSTLPSITLKNIYGKSINISEICTNNKPILICFWKTCCTKPRQYLDAINEIYDDLVEESDLTIYAIAIDDSRTSNKVRPFVQSHGWEFEVLLDINSDFKRSMNVTITPHTLLFNTKCEIVWQKMMYYPGDEEELLKKVKELKLNEYEEFKQTKNAKK